MKPTILTRDELLDLLQEECAEVIIAVAKCKRFGFERVFEAYGANHLQLAEEMGHVHALMHAILDNHGTNVMRMTERSARETKIAQAEGWKQANQ